jgi:hypothetical protein
MSRKRLLKPDTPTGKWKFWAICLSTLGLAAGGVLINQMWNRRRIMEEEEKRKKQYPESAHDFIVIPRRSRKIKALSEEIKRIETWCLNQWEKYFYAITKRTQEDRIAEQVVFDTIDRLEYLLAGIPDAAGFASYTTYMKESEGLVVLDVDSITTRETLFIVFTHEVAHRIAHKLYDNSVAVGEYGKAIIPPVDEKTGGYGGTGNRLISTLGYTTHSASHASWLFWKVMSIMYHYPTGENYYLHDFKSNPYKDDFYNYFFRTSWALCDEETPPTALFVVERDKVNDLEGWNPKYYVVDYKNNFYNILTDDDYNIIGLMSVIRNNFAITPWFYPIADYLEGSYTRLIVNSAIRYLIAGNLENLRLSVIRQKHRKVSWLDPEELFPTYAKGIDVYIDEIYNSNAYKDALAWLNKVVDNEIPLCIGLIRFEPSDFTFKEYVFDLNHCKNAIWGLTVEQKHMLYTKARLNFELTAADGHFWKYPPSMSIP